jgi:hypothetical protein
MQRLLTEEEYRTALELCDWITDKDDSDRYMWLLNFLFDKIEEYEMQDPVIRKWCDDAEKLDNGY